MNEPDKRAQEHIAALESDNDHLRAEVAALEELLAATRAELIRLKSDQWERD